MYLSEANFTFAIGFNDRFAFLIIAGDLGTLHVVLTN